MHIKCCRVLERWLVNISSYPICNSNYILYIGTKSGSRRSSVIVLLVVMAMWNLHRSIEKQKTTAEIDNNIRMNESMTKFMREIGVHLHGNR